MLNVSVSYTSNTVSVQVLVQELAFDFDLVLHWAGDVIEVIYYIHGPVEY